MRRFQLLIALAVVAVSLSTGGIVAAKPKGPGPNGPKPQARITWSIPRVEQSLTPGQPAQVEVTLTSSADLANVTLAAPGGLGKILAIEPASFASLRAGTPARVTLTFTAPAEGAHCQAGVIKVQAGKRAIPAPLKVKVTLTGATGCAP